MGSFTLEPNVVPSSKNEKKTMSLFYTIATLLRHHYNKSRRDK